MKPCISILQTGRLGDLWYTAPLARWYFEQGVEVEVVYDETFGNPFTFFPYIKPRPVCLRRYCSKNVGWGHFCNEAIRQLFWLAKLKQEERKVIWNEIFPFRWLQAHLKGRPYVEHWYRKYPEVDFRKAETTLDVCNDETILVFEESQSINFQKDKSYYDWIYSNLDLLVDKTGYRPIAVAYGNQPDHPKYDTWRGSLDDYQKLIARCGIVYGISTSAHVLGQLLGKTIIALYRNGQSAVDQIGNESAKLETGEQISQKDLQALFQVIKQC
jgi:hypothetical protein